MPISFGQLLYNKVTKSKKKLQKKLKIYIIVTLRNACISALCTILLKNSKIARYNSKR